MKNPSCIDLVLIKISYVFQQTTTACSGLSDCHKLVLTVLKNRGNPWQITGTDYKKFDSLKFNSELKNVLTKENTDNWTYCSLKRKLLKANHASYVSKALRKAIMGRSCLEKVIKGLQKAKKKNFLSRLYEKGRKKFFNSLNPSLLKDNKLFSKTVKPFFSSKGDHLLKEMNYNKMIKIIDVGKEIQNNDLKKATTKNSIPPKY